MLSRPTLSPQGTTRHRPRKHATPTGRSLMLALTFEAGGERLALDARPVAGVVPRVPLRPGAGAPAWLAGVFVYRGWAVPVVDLHRLAGAGDCPAHLSSRIILVRRTGPAGEWLLGLLAARVDDVRTIGPA